MRGVGVRVLVPGGARRVGECRLASLHAVTVHESEIFGRRRCTLPRRCHDGAGARGGGRRGAADEGAGLAV